MTPDELLKTADLDRIVKEGSLIYEEVRSRYEPTSNGQFLAIDIGSKKQYQGTTSAEAVAKARAEHPGNVYYVVKIGFDAAETLANMFVPKQ